MAPTPVSTPMPMPALTLYRMSCDLYERLAEQGLLGPKDRVVLLDGLLVNQMPIGPMHSTSVALGQIALQGAAPVGWYVRAQQPIILRNGPQGDSAPQPDLALVVGTILSYTGRHPIGTEVGLVVEVASDSEALRVDRSGLARYAHAGIPIACIVNISERSIEVHTEPSGPVADANYRKFETMYPGQSLTGEISNTTTGPAAIAPIPVESFFPPIGIE
ncbi:Uma2 family endonuclease [Tundrisphaera lichenicola]|uniref:Uma2 family endonuclease n=1 Tax=Tundrisphaera lichenicola TaxID=2029860 RepID=UPI003EB94174